MKKILLSCITATILISCSTRKPDAAEITTSIERANTIVAETIPVKGIEEKEDPLVHEHCYCETIPEELVPFILKDYQVREYVEGDLNRDGIKDYLLLLSLPYSGEIDSENNALRPLLILIRDKQNKLTLAARNDHVVDSCQDCGGQFGDFLDEIVIESSGSFSIYHLGGMAWRSKKEIFFEYTPEENNWLLKQESDYYYNAGMSEGDTLFDGQVYMPEENTKTPRDFGKLFFGDYNRALAADMK
ncbi:hypothetical protein [Pontibacter pudoricolor]|uniref:hypothetical protein n=1 Tax=Pontibacter pudoricolor TaxID=2694930 RepID=UPI001391ECB1|nr:hypothetical protein [Pontibacter pudoricolor]